MLHAGHRVAAVSAPDWMIRLVQTLMHGLVAADHSTGVEIGAILCTLCH